MELQELKTNICNILGLKETSITEHQLEQMANNFRAFERNEQQEKDKLMVMSSMIASGLITYNDPLEYIVNRSVTTATKIIQKVNEE